MRAARAASAVALCLILIAVAGCSRLVTGAAQRDATVVPAALSEDGSGITIGVADAPLRLEIYTEPQCRHCADLQADFGAQLAYNVAIGRLAITYRPLVLLDKDNGRDDGQHSLRVATAMFAAVTPGAPTGTVPTTGPQFQRFVASLWTLWDGGPNVPTVEEMAQYARGAGIPDQQVAKIESVQPSVDTANATDVNFEFLYMLDPLDTATPYVYDIGRDKTLDIYDNDWLAKALES